MALYIYLSIAYVLIPVFVGQACQCLNSIDLTL